VNRIGYVPCCSRALQNFILQQTNGAEVPLAQQYTASPGVVTGTPGSTFNFTLPTQQQVGSFADNASASTALAAIWALPPVDLGFLFASAGLKTLSYTLNPPSPQNVLYDTVTTAGSAVLPPSKVFQTVLGITTTVAQPLLIPESEQSSKK